MTAAALGLATGLAFGAVLARGAVCFNVGLRRAAFERRPTPLRLFAVAIGVELLLVPVLYVAGVSPVVENVDAGSPALFWLAQLAGGLVFGAGMALAGGCITGILWKSGAGSIATGLAIAGFAAGELLAQGPGSGVLAELDGAGRARDGTLPVLTGVPYELLAPAIGFAALLWLVRRSTGLALGVAMGAIATLAWMSGDLAGYGYGLGFVGAAEGTREALANGGELPFQLWLALGVIAGGAAAIRGPLRLPDRARCLRAVAGGLLMGVGASAAHGCNIGHGVTGLGLLSLGSLLAVAAMAAGALATQRFVLLGHPGLRGRESPAASAW